MPSATVRFKYGPLGSPPNVTSSTAVADLREVEKSLRLILVL